MIREKLTAHPASEQLAFDSFESRSALEKNDQFGYGVLPRRMDRQNCQVTNMSLLNRWRFVELMRMLNQVTVEFQDPGELSQMFQRMGVNTRTGDIYELYLESDDLLCNYCFQVNLERDASFFVKVIAFVKEKTKSVPRWHRH